MFRVIATGMIKFYQHFISPYKGFTCAHNALHQQGGCSSRVLKHIKSRPITQWYQSYKEEVVSCRHAYDIIQASREEDKQKKGNCCTDALGEAACNSVMPDNCGSDACNGCDINPCS